MCPANCADVTLLANPDAGCQPKVRKRGLFKLGFYLCNVDLPDPLTCENLEALITSGDVVFSSPLVNAEWAAPETEELVIADCLPALQQVTARTLTFQDRIALDVLEAPSVESNLYADLKFWGNKQEVGLSLRYLFLWCDGVIDKAVDEFGKPMAASFQVYRGFERQGSGGNSYTLEIKTGTIVFKGDPLALRSDYEPALVVDGVDCADLSETLGLNI